MAQEILEHLMDTGGGSKVKTSERVWKNTRKRIKYECTKVIQLILVAQPQSENNLQKTNLRAKFEGSSSSPRLTKLHAQGVHLH